MRITGELNNPTISFMASEDAKLSPDISPDIKEESQDTELKVESGDIKSEPESRDIKTESPDIKNIKNIKEELSKDENTVD